MPKNAPVFQSICRQISQCFRPPTVQPKNSSLFDTMYQLTPLRSGSVIYVDTSSLLHPYGPALLDAMEKLLSLTGQKLHLFPSVLRELERVGNREKDLFDRSKTIQEKLRRLEHLGLLNLNIGADPNFSDINFIAYFIEELAKKHPVVLISQDNGLSECAMRIPDFLAPCATLNNAVHVMRLTRSGTLEAWHAPQTQDPIVIDHFKEECDYEYPNSSRVLSCGRNDGDIFFHNAKTSSDPERRAGLITERVQFCP